MVRRCLLRLSFAALVADASLGCAARDGAQPMSPGKDDVARATPAGGFRAPLGAEHPLVGRIWSTRAGRFVDEATLRAALRGYVLLGEKHDNVDHHALQAQLLDEMREDGRRPAVAFEMLDASAQEKVDIARRGADAADAIARAVDWAASGWPDFAMYRPVFRAALATGEPILATGIAPATMRALVRGGDEGAAALTETGAPAPLDDTLRSSLREELVASHCGHLPASIAEGMVQAQRARDASMARVMVRALAGRSSDGTARADVVLIAGSGHARNDRGVPRDLAASDGAHPITSVAFAEVEPDRKEPADYAARWHAPTLPFDFVWFTPRASDEDACAAMMKGRRATGAGQR
jgi:uncharacterized iron-regulated protein